MLHWDEHAGGKRYHGCIFIPAKDADGKLQLTIYVTIFVHKQDLLILKLCMTRMINLSNYLLIIMYTIRNFTILSPLFASVTAHMTITTFSFTSRGTT